MKLKYIVEFFKQDRIEIIHRREVEASDEVKRISDLLPMAEKNCIYNNTTLVFENDKFLCSHPAVYHEDCVIEEYLSNKNIHIKLLLSWKWYKLLPTYIIGGSDRLTFGFDLEDQAEFLEHTESLSKWSDIKNIDYSFHFHNDKICFKDSYLFPDGIVLSNQYESSIMTFYMAQPLTLKFLLLSKIYFGRGTFTHITFAPDYKKDPKRFFIEMDNIIDLFNKVGANIKIRQCTFMSAKGV